MPRPALTLCLLVAVGCTDPSADTGPTPAPGVPIRDAHSGGVRLSDELTTATIGTECAECHAEIVASYTTSGMHDSITLPSGGDTPEGRIAPVDVVHENGAVARFVTRDGQYRQQLILRADDGTEHITFDAPVDLIVGSGHAGRSYARVTGDALHMLPLSWYSETQALGRSPGPGFRHVATRAMTTRCIACHTGVAKAADPLDEFAFRGDITLGVGCARCHGDGAAHAESGDPGDIVHPARLPVQRQDELCAQCHLSTGIDAIVPGVDSSEYVPGTPLNAVLGVFAPKHSDGAPTIAGHGLRLRRSACFTKSEGALTCTTCHNPHRGHKADDTTPGAESGCAVCHDAGDCGEEHGLTKDRTCAECHMVRVASVDIEHTTTTDHWIQKRPGRDGASRPENDRLSISAVARLNQPLVNLIDPEGEGAHAGVLEAMAYLHAADAFEEGSGRPAVGYLQRALTALDAHLAVSSDDIEALWRKGSILRRMGDPTAAYRLIDRVLTESPDHPHALAERGYISQALDRDGDAVPFLRRALDARPDDAELAFALAAAYERSGRAASGIDVLVAFRDRSGPRLDVVTNGLGLAMRAGDRDRALLFIRDGRTLMPRDPDLRAREAQLLRAR